MEAEDTLTQGNTEPSNKKSKDGKRFTDEQVKLLEFMFKLETKLEPRKKLELARDLGLQPRQVAIWFQNRRARWKSKQMEHEYRVLKAEFDGLNMQFESLKQEKESLLKQLEELNDQLENNHAGCSRSQDSLDSEIYTSSENGGTDLELKDNIIPGCLNASLEDKRVEEVENDREGTLIEHFRWKEEPEFWNMEELGDSSLGSPGRWCAVGLGRTFDLSWEF
ncbi:uncharacterized protein LOC107810623 [Nicotiana tabacum]|uniref:Homeobox-leucine zipper protein n=1 Tax=Nicotiana tabacum TaxID=4097 RepID=A0A1S4BPU4_TOBAC|nr:homeobox-leucine zipper protein ATHB-7-like [Nicotiana tomentosiformis]XP_016490907.1 PREDICTED: homeobox-leucine zipper protein ATHB-7-like [Nicotiana tabacum]